MNSDDEVSNGADCVLMIVYLRNSSAQYTSNGKRDEVNAKKIANRSVSGIK